MAAFLMIFAFAASSSLFHAALQWESQGSNVRRAALVAEKKIGEIRAWSEEFHTTHSFDEGWDSIDGVQPEYPEAPGFEITVIADLPTYDPNPTTGLTPPPGLYGPTSHFWATVPGIPALPNDFANPQKNPTYSTFSRARTFDKSVRRVQVVVRYGLANSRVFRSVTLVGDPIVSNGGSDPAITISPVIPGPSSVSVGSPADYSVKVEVQGHEVPDVVCLWGVDPDSTGAVFVKPTDANGRGARVFRPSFGNPGTTRLAVRLRYRGQEYTKFSDSINVL